MPGLVETPGGGPKRRLHHPGDPRAAGGGGLRGGRLPRCGGIELSSTSEQTSGIIADQWRCAINSSLRECG